MGFFSSRIAFILFIFLFFGVAIFASRSVVVHKFLSSYLFSSSSSSSSSQQVEVTEALLLERWAMAFPDVIERLSKMSPQQQELFIEQVRRDAVLFASESGQSREKAHKFGETVAMALSKAMSRPSIANAYF
ncbi:hypothetical protein MNL01_05735 [Bartonella krasnovii]|uniref:Uncharacterized protein n=1 Tax=Bartonella krasnovii TaxID=2267275 RepID=A0A5B9D2R3_9HYPH|nr:hypothetical protein [Bartonella krasnovii]QEE12481.1 hypothetical protein D1092_05695 [Bartonella krasnovii]UNF41666.1 hypothetical protein MNL08_05570 [Bartonella krasnovii]UNF44913.1 hypothetical protein MNL06_04840 [Bartonella krasnovii]UNF53168.1 hypothetical protein MNL01_05735 [Bartonella krasnovii]UNF54870.1 hypothetical protein MNL00_05580 [Bartonella krasnovii]